MMIKMPVAGAWAAAQGVGQRVYTVSPKSLKLPLWAVIFCAACSNGSRGPLEVSGAPPRTVSVGVNQELRIKLQTIGPGEYVSPPTISGSALLFLEASVVGPFLPGGPTQEFRFKAVTRGQSIIAFHHTQSGPDVSDTVIVR